MTRLAARKWAKAFFSLSPGVPPGALNPGFSLSSWSFEDSDPLPQHDFVVDMCRMRPGVGGARKGVGNEILRERRWRRDDPPWQQANSCVEHRWNQHTFHFHLHKNRLVNSTQLYLIFPGLSYLSCRFHKRRWLEGDNTWMNSSFELIFIERAILW